MSIAQIYLDRRQAVELARDAARPAAADGIVWLDVFSPTEDDLAWLAHTYNFHPLAIEDCRHFNQRAKAESYSDYLFLSLTTPARIGEDLQAQEMEAFLGADYLVTVHRELLPAIDSARERSAPSKRPDFLLYLITDQMVDAYFPLLDAMEDEIDELEDEILENATQSTMHRIFSLKQQLVYLRKISAPMRDVMNSLAGTRYGLIDAQTALYFRDLYDHLTRIYDLVETSRDLLGNALDAYLSIISNRMNEVMKRLTLFTAVFMPISFLVGFAGINFQQMPFDNAVVFTLLLGLLVILPIIMLIWFWRSKWV